MHHNHVTIVYNGVWVLGLFQLFTMAIELTQMHTQKLDKKIKPQV